MYKGSCICGAIQLELNGGITDIIHCHCSICRKVSGTAFATNGFINSADLHIIDDSSLLGFYEKIAGKRRYFCKQCATPIYSANAENPGKLRIRLGVIDTDISERPISHNFVTSKANWEDLDATLPRYPSYEPSRNKT